MNPGLPEMMTTFAQVIKKCASRCSNFFQRQREDNKFYLTN